MWKESSAKTKCKFTVIISELRSYWSQLSALRCSVCCPSFTCLASGCNSDELNQTSFIRHED